MKSESPIQAIQHTVNALLTNDPDCFLVSVKIKPINNIKVYLDGDHGITIQKCTAINRALYKHLEEAQTFGDENFSLEVSSAGVGEPLLLQRQYVKNIGRGLEIKTKDGKVLEGTLQSAEGEHLILETVSGKGKKAEVKQHEILLDDIQSAVVQIKF